MHKWIGKRGGIKCIVKSAMERVNFWDSLAISNGIAAGIVGLNLISKLRMITTRTK
jgi:hypothetical protein